MLVYVTTAKLAIRNEITIAIWILRSVNVYFELDLQQFYLCAIFKFASQINSFVILLLTAMLVCFECCRIVYYAPTNQRMAGEILGQREATLS